MDNIGIFPGLMSSVIDLYAPYSTYSWECTIVPQVTFVREAVANESELALLHVLFDGIPECSALDRCLRNAVAACKG